MLRITLFALGVAGILSACTEYDTLPPAQPMMAPQFSDSVGFTGVGYEPFSTGFSHPG
jgi:hypothetical protein